MRTVSKVKVGQGATAESAFDWYINPEGEHLCMTIEAKIVDGAHALTWHDQFALLDAAWLALVDLRRAERRHARRSGHRGAGALERQLRDELAKNAPTMKI